MKKLIFIIGFITLFSSQSFAGDKNDSDYLLNVLTSVLHGTYSANSREILEQTTIMYKNQLITAYHNTNVSWAGFLKRINVSELPVNAHGEIKRKSNNAKISAALMFMNTDGDIVYFAAIQNQKTYTVYEISQAGNVNLFMKCIREILQ